MSPVEEFIRKAAIARGINPDIAVRVAMSEGGVVDPFRHSDVVNARGIREESYGPFQMLMTGGLGSEMLKSGHDPRKEWKAGVEYALDTAARKRSWGDFHGAANTGIANDAGFGEGTKPQGITLTSGKYGGSGAAAFPIPDSAASGVQPGISAPPVPGVPAAPAAPGTAAGAGGMGKMFEALGSLAGAFGGKSVSDPSANQLSPSSIDINRPSAAAAAQMMAQLMEERRKRYKMGTTLTSGGPDIGV